MILCHPDGGAERVICFEQSNDKRIDGCPNPCDLTSKYGMEYEQ
jgi:hypothetical protein